MLVWWPLLWYSIIMIFSPEPLGWALIETSPLPTATSITPLFSPLLSSSLLYLHTHTVSELRLAGSYLTRNLLTLTCQVRVKTVLCDRSRKSHRHLFHLCPTSASLLVARLFDTNCRLLFETSSSSFRIQREPRNGSQHPIRL